MDFGGLRALVLDLNFTTHGVPATVTRPFPDETPIVTRGIWLTPITENAPGGTDFQRREPYRVMALSRAEIPTIPRGSLIDAPEKSGDATQTWRVDGYERQEADQHRVVVIQEPEA